MKSKFALFGIVTFSLLFVGPAHSSTRATPRSAAALRSLMKKTMPIVQYRILELELTARQKLDARNNSRNELRDLKARIQEMGDETTEGKILVDEILPRLMLSDSDLKLIGKSTLTFAQRSDGEGPQYLVVMVRRSGAMPMGISEMLFIPTAELKTLAAGEVPTIFSLSESRKKSDAPSLWESITPQPLRDMPRAAHFKTSHGFDFYFKGESLMVQHPGPRGKRPTMVTRY